MVNLVTKYTSRRVSAYNTLTHASIKVLRRKYPKLTDNHAVISTCVDTDLFSFRPKLPQNPLGLLSGTYNSIYDSQLIAQFSEYLILNYGHKIVWVRGEESSPEIKKLGQQEIFASSYTNIPSHIAQSSYGISVCRNDLGDSLKAAMPTKIAEFLSVGRPVVVNSELGDVKDFLIQNNVAVSLDSSIEIPRAAQRLHELIGESSTPARCRKIAVSMLSLNIAVTQYTKLYSSILQ